MSFTNNVEAIGSSDNIFHTVATGFEASVHALLINNPSGSSETVTIKIKNNASGTTVNSIVIVVGANSSYTYPRPINLAQQDQLILISTGTAAIGTTSIYTQLMSGVPSSITLTARGAWSSSTSYTPLDIVSYNGGSWISILASVGVTPVEGSDWAINASQGAAGTLTNVVEDTTPQLGGNLDANGHEIAFGETIDTVYNITDGASFEIDPANGNVQTITLGASRTAAATNFAAGQSIIIGVDDGSAYALTWPTTTWIISGGGGAAPDLATAGYTWVILWKQGSTLFGGIVGSP